MRPVEVRVLSPEEEHLRRMSFWSTIALAPVVALAAFAGWKGVAMMTSEIADLHPAIDWVIGIAIGLVAFMIMIVLLLFVRPLRWLYALAVSSAVGFLVYAAVQEKGDATWGVVAAIPVALIVLVVMLNTLKWLKSE